MSEPGDYDLYRDRGKPVGRPDASAGGSTNGPAACPACGGRAYEEGFVEGTSDSLVRYYASPREDGLFGVKRFGLERRAVLARRCTGCSRLDLYAPHPD